MNETIEQRKYSRSLISLSVQVRLDTGVLVEGCARNVSLSGLFFETERSLPLGSKVKVKLTVGNAEETAEICCSGEVSRLDERGVAIELGNIGDESMTRLCELIRATSTDKLSLEKELEARLKTLRSNDRVKVETEGDCK